MVLSDDHIHTTDTRKHLNAAYKKTNWLKLERQKSYTLWKISEKMNKHQAHVISRDMFKLANISIQQTIKYKPPNQNLHCQSWHSPLVLLPVLFIPSYTNRYLEKASSSESSSNFLPLSLTNISECGYFTDQMSTRLIFTQIKQFCNSEWMHHISLLIRTNRQ